MGTSPASTACAALKGDRPEFLRVYLDDDSVANVAVPKVKRWKPRVAAIVDSMPWRSIEPLDAKGNVLGARQDNSELGAATELENLDELPEGIHTDVMGLLQLMLKAQDVALVRQKQAYDSVLDNNQKLLAVISDRLKSMEKSAHDNFQMMMELRNKLVSADGEGEGGDTALLVEALKMANNGKANAA
jgi:flagellar hook-basal body complex protein FliE